MSRWTAFDTGLTAASLADGSDVIGAVGQGGILTAEGGREVRFEVTHFEPERLCYTFTSELILANLHVHRAIALADSGAAAAVTHEVWFDGWLGRGFALLLGATFRQQLPAVVQRVVRTATI